MPEGGNVTTWMQAMMSIDFIPPVEEPVESTVEVAINWQNWVDEIWGEIDANGSGNLDVKEATKLLELA